MKNGYPTYGEGWKRPASCRRLSAEERKFNVRHTHTHTLHTKVSSVITEGAELLHGRGRRVTRRPKGEALCVPQRLSIHHLTDANLCAPLRQRGALSRAVILTLQTGVRAK